MSISTIARRTAVLTAATTLAGTAAAGAALAATAAATSLSVKVTHGTVAAGQSDTLTGSLRAGKTAVAGQKVDLLERLPGASKWSTVQSGTTAAKTGQVSFTVKDFKRNEQFELLHPATAAYGRSVSAVVTVHVAPHVSATLASSSVRHGQTTTLSVRLTPSQAGQTVYLQVYGSNKKWSDSSHKALNSKSATSFTVGSSKAGKVTYRVRIGASSSHAAAVSKPVTLTVS